MSPIDWDNGWSHIKPPIILKTILPVPHHCFLTMSAATILFLTICATAPLSLLRICGVHLIILPAWWRRNSTGAWLMTETVNCFSNVWQALGLDPTIHGHEPYNPHWTRWGVRALGVEEPLNWNGFQGTWWKSSTQVFQFRRGAVQALNTQKV